MVNPPHLQQEERRVKSKFQTHPHPCPLSGHHCHQVGVCEDSEDMSGGIELSWRIGISRTSFNSLNRSWDQKNSSSAMRGGVVLYKLGSNVEYRLVGNQFWHSQKRGDKVCVYVLSWYGEQSNKPGGVSLGWGSMQIAVSSCQKLGQGVDMPHYPVFFRSIPGRNITVGFLKPE